MFKLLDKILKEINKKENKKMSNIDILKLKLNFLKKNNFGLVSKSLFFKNHLFRLLMKYYDIIEDTFENKSKRKDCSQCKKIKNVKNFELLMIDMFLQNKFSIKEMNEINVRKIEKEEILREKYTDIKLEYIDLESINCSFYSEKENKCKIEDIKPLSCRYDYRTEENLEIYMDIENSFEELFEKYLNYSKNLVNINIMYYLKNNEFIL